MTGSCAGILDIINYSVKKLIIMIKKSFVIKNKIK
jgi:hypothetical protein